MADDKFPETATEKPIVVESGNVLSSSSGGGGGARRSSTGSGGGSRGNANNTGSGGRGHHQRKQEQQQQNRQETREDNSSEASLSAGVTGSPGKSNRNSNRDKRSKEGRPRRGGGGGGRDQGRKGTNTPDPSGAPTLEDGTGSPAPQQQEGSSTSTPKNKTNKSKYSVRKRAPPKEDYEIKPNDVFVNEKSNFLAQLSKCKRLFEKGNREIYLHGLGKAIPRAINIAFELKKFYHETVDYTINTSTIQLCDDVYDLENPDQPPTVRTRNVSSVDIKVFRSLNIP